MWVWERCKQDDCPVPGGVECGRSGLNTNPLLFGSWVEWISSSGDTIHLCLDTRVEGEGTGDSRRA